MKTLPIKRWCCKAIGVACGSCSPAAYAAALGVLFTLTPLHAQIGTIVITGEEEQESTGDTGNSFEIGDTATGEHTGFLEVIEKDQLQQAGSSLAEVVAAESGVQFRQSGGQGTFSSVSLRGSSAEQVNVYLDGILLNEASGGGVNFSDIELLQAEKVEVYKGTVPVQLGNSAIGGAVNITTKRAGGAPVASALAGFGSFGSSRFSAAFRAPVNLLSDQTVVGSLTFRSSANDFSFLNDNGTNFNTADDQRERRNNGDTRSISGFLKTGHRLGSLRLEHALQLFDRSQGVANWRNRPADARLDSDNVQLRSTLRSTADTGGWSSLWELTGSLKSEVFDDSNGSIGTIGQLIESDTSVLGARGYWEKVNDRTSLSVSLRTRGESFESINRLNQINATIADRLRADLSVQHNRYYNDGYTLLSGSVTGFVVSDDYEIENFEQARDDFSLSTLLPQAGFSHRLSDRWLVLGNASLQKRAPSFFELFGAQGLFVGNASLNAETSENFDIGVKWNSDPSNCMDSTVTATYFHSNRDDLIVRTFNAQGVGRSQNLSRATARGVELGATAAWQSGFAVDVSMTLQDTVNRSQISGQTGKQLPGEAAFDGAFTTTWANDKWKLGYEFRINTDRFYDAGNFLVAPDQRLHSVSVSRSWSDWRIDLELNNLTDQNFEDFNGFPRPGRAGFLSLLYQPK